MAKNKIATVRNYMELLRDLSNSKGRVSLKQHAQKNHVTQAVTVTLKQLGYVDTGNGSLGALWVAERITNEADLRMHGHRLWSATRQYARSYMRSREQGVSKVNTAKKVTHNPRKADARADEFYDCLPDYFTTAKALEIASRVGVPKSTMARLFKQDKRYYRMKHGQYVKQDAVKTYTKQLDFKAGNDSGTVAFLKTMEDVKEPEPAKPSVDVTVNMPPRTVSILWGLFRFTL